MKSYLIVLLMMLGVFSPLWTFASNEESPLVERVRQGDVAALRALLDESYRQRKDLPRAFYYLALYHKATGRSFFEDDAKAFDELGGLFNNAVMCVHLLDVKLKELEAKKTQLQKEKKKLEQDVERYTKELRTQEQKAASQAAEHAVVLEEKNNLLDQVSALDAELERVKTAHGQATATEVDLSKKLEECKNTIQTLELEIKALEAANTSLEQEIVSYIEKVALLEQSGVDEDYFKIELAKRDTNIANLIAANEDLLQRLESLKHCEEELNERDKQVGSLKNENAKLKATIANMPTKEVFESATRTLKERDKELIRATKKLEKAQQSIYELEKQCAILKGEYIDRGRESQNLGETPAAVGASRGLLTVLMSPLNYLRAPLHAHELTLSDPHHNPKNKVATYGETAILLIPAIVVETVPCAVDIANGFLDFVTFGYYGDEVYGVENSPWWWERTNRTFPWINKY